MRIALAVDGEDRVHGGLGQVRAAIRNGDGNSVLASRSRYRERVVQCRDALGPHRPARLGHLRPVHDRREQLPATQERHLRRDVSVEHGGHLVLQSRVENDRNRSLDVHQAGAQVLCRNGEVADGAARSGEQRR